MLDAKILCSPPPRKKAKRAKKVRAREVQHAKYEVDQVSYKGAHTSRVMIVMLYNLVMKVLSLVLSYMMMIMMENLN
jgi:hypothetical protein